MLRKFSLTLASVVALGGAALAQPAQLRYVDSACSISMSEFNTWFVSGQMAQNGVVTFANSVGFPTNNTVCDFYKWAHQMFLWIVSPVSGGLVLDSPIFYDVNFNAQGQGVYVPNQPGRTAGARTFALRGSKPEGFQPGGQAGGNDMLISLNGSLVYFGIHANDVYAWFNTAVIKNAPGFPSTAPFPTTQAQLASLVSYAAQNGATLPDANALTMELKSAWVDASTVPNPQNYVTIQASVPNYVGSIGAARWTINQQQPTVVKTLALVGLHVVGPVQGHPELVWATFEHRANAPDNSFYFSPNIPIGPPPVIQVPYNSAGTWLFMRNGGGQQGANVTQATIDSSGNVVAAKTPPGVNANNTYRVNPWGGPPTPASAGNNTQLLSLNIDIRNMLSFIGDVRQNYFQVGAVWTRNGSIPSSGTDTANQVGSLALANTTMETYHQTDKIGCFGCHFNKAGNPPTGTSHLFSTNNVPLPTR